MVIDCTEFDAWVGGGGCACFSMIGVTTDVRLPLHSNVISSSGE